MYYQVTYRQSDFHIKSINFYVYKDEEPWDKAQILIKKHSKNDNGKPEIISLKELPSGEEIPDTLYSKILNFLNLK